MTGADGGPSGADVTTRRRLLAGLAAVGTVGLGGCVTLSPSLDEEFPESDVFESVTASESWAALRVPASITLSERAAEQSNLRELVVIDGSGSKYLDTAVANGQTSVGTYLPLGQRVTLVAVNSAGETVEQVSFRTP